MPTRSYRALLWLLAFVGLALDQATKYGVFKWLYSPSRYVGEYDVFPNAFKLLVQYTDQREPADSWLGSLRTVSAELLPKVNQGALFGLGNDYQHLANGFFAAVSLVAAVSIIVWSCRRATAREFSLCAALGLILAGTLGNLYDRLVFHGVRDFLYFYWIEWPVFNVADCCLVCGALLLLTQAFWGQQILPEPVSAQPLVAREPAQVN